MEKCRRLIQYGQGMDKSARQKKSYKKGAGKDSLPFPRVTQESRAGDHIFRFT